MRLDAESERRAREILFEGTTYFWSWAGARFGAQEERYPVPEAWVIAFVTDHLEGLPEAVEAALVAAKVKKPGPHRLSTVERRLSTLSQLHRLEALPNPCQAPAVRELLSKARRRAAHRGQRTRKKTAVPRELLERFLEHCSREELRGLRDRALLLFAWASGGRRRSEVAALRVEDLQEVPGGYLAEIRVSKTDQAGEGLTVPVLGRAGEALREWLDAAAITAGPVFRPINRHGQLGERALSGRAVWELVKKKAALAGLDPGDFGAHSLRSGYITEGGRQGVHIRDLMALSGHRSLTVAMGYHQAGSLFKNPGARLAEGWDSL